MNTKKACVIGSNVKKSLSPTIFNYWFKKYKINGEYLHKEIKNNLFKKEVKPLITNKEFSGFNITIPFKEKIIPYLGTIDKHSSRIGAVNCTTRIRNKLRGQNTDWLGFNESIKKKKINKGTAIVIGYGGASKAIIYSLIFQKFKKIKIFNRTFKKIKNIKSFPSPTSSTAFKNISPHKLKELHKHLSTATLIINTTPINVLKNIPKKTENKINRKAFGFDIAYRPKTGTGFLKNFQHNQRINGMQMLVCQAAPCFKLWFGTLPQTNDKKLFNLLYKKK